MARKGDLSDFEYVWQAGLATSESADLLGFTQTTENGLKGENVQWLPCCQTREWPDYFKLTGKQQ